MHRLLFAVDLIGSVFISEFETGMFYWVFRCANLSVRLQRRWQIASNNRLTLVNLNSLIPQARAECRTRIFRHYRAQ